MSHGFSLIELMTVIVLMSLLVLAAMPSFTTWTRNTKVRSAADDLQNAIRTAQTEAMRRSRQVVFFFSDNPTASTVSATTNRKQWAIAALPLDTGGTNKPEVVEMGTVTDVANGVGVTGPVALCFNSLGRLVPNAALSTSISGAQCSVNSEDPPPIYSLQMSGSDRPLNVTVALGGQVRLCDPAKAFPTDPEGCPQL